MSVYKVVILVSSDTEWSELKKILQPRMVDRSVFGEMYTSKLGAVDVLIFQSGWGKVTAAATTQFVIDHYHPSLLMNLATCGGFLGRTTVGEIICVNHAIIYDIIEQMSDPQEAIDFYSTSIDLSWLKKDWLHGVTMDRIVSADRDLVLGEITLLQEQFDARVGDWESGPIAWVAGRNQQRLLILRGVSDVVGASGGEVYENMTAYTDRTNMVMKRLITIAGEFLSHQDVLQLIGY